MDKVETALSARSGQIKQMTEVHQAYDVNTKNGEIPDYMHAELGTELFNVGKNYDKVFDLKGAKDGAPISQIIEARLAEVSTALDAAARSVEFAKTLEPIPVEPETEKNQEDVDEDQIVPSDANQEANEAANAQSKSANLNPVEKLTREEIQQRRMDDIRNGIWQHSQEQQDRILNMYR